MIRTLIFGAIAGYVGKKLYDEGKLTEFKEDLVSRYHQVRDDMSSRSGQAGHSSSMGASSTASSPVITPSAARPSPTNSSIVS